MARIFVAHQQEGTPSPLAGVADAIKEQRLMQEEQRRYEQQVVQEDRKVALAGEQLRYQRQRDRIEDKFRRQELRIRRTQAEATAAYQRARSGAAGMQAADDVSKLSLMQFGAAKTVEDHFSRWSSIPVDQRMPQDKIDARQAEYEELLLGYQSAPTPEAARVLDPLLKEMIARDNEEWDEYSATRRVDTLTQRRDELRDNLLDPETRASYGLSEDSVLNAITDSDDEAKLRDQVDKLEDLLRMGEENNRLGTRLSDIANGKDKSEFSTKMQELHRTARPPAQVSADSPGAWMQDATAPWISKYEGWLGAGGKLRQMTDMNEPIGRRNALMEEYIGLLHLEADPNLATARDGYARAVSEVAAMRETVATERAMLSGVAQATLPDLPAIQSNLRTIVDQDPEESGLSSEARDLADALEDVLLSDEQMAEGVVGPTSLIDALNQVRETTTVSEEAARELFGALSLMGAGPAPEQPSVEPEGQAGGSVLDLAPQADPLAGKRAGAGDVDFSLEEE